MTTEFSKKLLTWYHRNARALPWRGERDAYAVWVSEIMLQQTRVETVIPYYLRWMEQFPTVEALACASEQDVLRTWEGLGYYSRARNLHRAAGIVTREYEGRLPTSREQLEKLPGIGAYTSAAIASIAFGEDSAAVDGNVKRVLARYFNVTLPANSHQGEAELRRLAQTNLPAGRAGDYNQALMDLGATVCLPKNPLCGHCPVDTDCQANRLQLQSALPVLEKAGKIPHYTVTAGILRQNGRVLIARRPNRGLLGGMWEFPGGKKEKGETLAHCLEREIKEELGCTIETGREFGIFNHAYTHFAITLHCFECRLSDGTPRPIEASEIRWVEPADLIHFPMGKVDRLISKKIVNG